MKKKTILSIMIILIILGIGAGVIMKIHTDKSNEVKQEQEIKHAEDLIANDIRKKYEGVRSISFEEVQENHVTGAIYFLFKLNNDDTTLYNYTYFSETDFGLVGRTSPAQKFKARKKAIKSNSIKIKYKELGKDNE